MNGHRLGRRVMALWVACLSGFLPGLARAQKPEVVAPTQIAADPVPYPPNAHGAAEVVLELVIAQDGTVGDVQVREGSEPFASAAQRAVSTWQFTPATRDGIPIRARITAKVSFREPVIVPQAPAQPAPNAAKVSNETTSNQATSNAAPKTEPVAPAATEIRVLGEERQELGSLHIPRSETRLIPGAFADPFRVVEVLPGVAPVLSGIPYFYVRGAPPGDVGYRIDDIPVPLLFHVGAGPSVIAPALVDRVDLFPGAYPAEHGRVAGAVIAGETLAPSSVLHGEAQARIFDAGAMIEAPFANGRGSVVLGGRYGYTQAILSLVAPDYGLNYWDYQARIAYRINATDTISAFAFGALDQLSNEVLHRTLFDTQFHRLDLRWDRHTEQSHVRVAFTLGADHVLNGQEGRTNAGSELRDDTARLRLEASQRLSPELRLRGGADAGAANVKTETDNFGSKVVSQPQRVDLTGGAYVDAIWRPARAAEIVPGVRLDLTRAREQNHVFVEPRLGTRLRLAQGVSWVSAFGVAHQMPTQSVRVPGRTPNGLELAQQEAWQATTGVEFVLPASMLGKVSLFHNWVDALDADITGRSYGAEFFVRRNFSERLGGFVSYTLSRTTYTRFRDTYQAEFDRPHVLSLVLGYDLGRGYRIGGRTLWESGRRYAEACPTPDCGPGDPTAPRPYVVMGRTHSFFRLDFRFEKRWQLAAGRWISGTFEWFNATLSKEADYVEWDPVHGGIVTVDRSPLTLPSIGVEMGF
ncbi:MAG TPA: TonB family protein [Polyangiaceae bacterium]|nr:TonB family protein [Polyangiaceae bacterium]